MSVNVDPQQVLSCLNTKGYYNISASQLKDFVKDLKKLIKHDLRNSKKTTNSSEVCTSSISSSTCNTKNTSTNSCEVCTSSVSSSTCNTSCFNGSNEESPTDSKYTSTDEEEDSGSTNGVQEVHNHEILQKYANLKCTSKPSTIQKVADRPRSAFIKTWQVQRAAPPQRSDPVALYHKYQSIWRQQKVPGDANRIELRWNVREKMLGTHPRPLPRVASQASGMERIAGPKRNCYSMRLNCHW